MKKILITALVLFLSFGLFAAGPDAQLTLTTQVLGTTGLKLSQGAAFEDWSSSSYAGPLTVSSALVDTLFVNLQTNERSDYAIRVSAPALAQSGQGVADYEITYTMQAVANDNDNVGTPGGQIVSYKRNPGEPGTLPILVTFAGDDTGLRILSHNFELQVHATELQNAVVGIYSAIVQFHIDSP